MCVYVFEVTLTQIGVIGDNVKGFDKHTHTQSLSQYMCFLSAAGVANIKMISMRAAVAVHARMCMRVPDGRPLVPVSQTSYLKSKNSRATHQELTRSPHTSLCSFRWRNTFFPTQVNWLHLWDQ